MASELYLHTCLLRRQLEEELRKSGLRSALPAAAAEVWAEFAIATQGQLLAASSPLESLIDVEWTFGVTASSSELEAVGSTYVQLRLTLSGDNGRARFAHIELSLPKFYELLHQLESAKAQLEVL
uniref:COMM domain-containing protein n=1 Tax=Chrysotila carterae TaxID=13221 RepID=A0A6S9UC12_CHRCT